jgi:RNA polymerase sigma factor (sigma-70 family)
LKEFHPAGFNWPAFEPCGCGLTPATSAGLLRAVLDVTLAERALVAACAAGDAEAWEALRGRYHRTLHGALREAGARDDIDDLEQEVWARLLARDRAALRDFRGGSLKAFLTQVARAVAIDHGRARRARPPGTGGEEPHGLPSGAPDAEHRLAERQERRRFAAALDQVAAASENPARDRDVLHLHFDEEMSPHEIAGLGIGLTARGVEALLRRASARLRELLRYEEP